ncbi:hypothetical protein ABZ078_38460 [Streptomyces sp. NPDC006385]
MPLPSANAADSRSRSERIAAEEVVVSEHDILDGTAFKVAEGTENGRRGG